MCCPPACKCSSLFAGVDQVACPVHAVRHVLASLQQAEGLFPGIALGNALVVLCIILREVGVDSAGAYRTHDSRRGHALGLQPSDVWCARCGSAVTGLLVVGATLAEILLAGEWSLPAFLQHLDMYRQERNAVLQAHFDKNDGGVGVK